MNCKLCDKAIINYNPSFNHLIIDETHEADICRECADKIIKWQGRICSVLFPTKAMKKLYGKK